MLQTSIPRIVKAHQPPYRNPAVIPPTHKPTTARLFLPLIHLILLVALFAFHNIRRLSRRPGKDEGLAAIFVVAEGAERFQRLC
jgi:hypothetical protein